MLKKARSFNSRFLKVVKWIGVVVVGLIMALIMVIGIARISTYTSNRINTANGVDEGVYVTLGGQEQYLLIRGKDIDNPVIIWLHGGPAGPDAYTNYVFQQQLIDSYTVVNWDQRGCGRTYFRNIDRDPNNETATFEQTQIDLDDLVNYLCERFKKDKVIIIGHSYGTAVGSQYAITHPDQVAAYIGVGQLVSFDSEVYSYEDALQKAIASGDDTSAMEFAYQEFLDDKTLMNMLKLRGQVSEYHISEKSDNNNTPWFAIKSPYMGIDDIRWFLKQVESTEDFISLNKNLFDYIMGIDVREYGMNYQVPVGFMSGSDDWTTPVKYTSDYYDLITAPEKQMQLIDGCGHYPQYEDPESFCETLETMLNSLVEYY